MREGSGANLPPGSAQMPQMPQVPQPGAMEYDYRNYVAPKRSKAGLFLIIVIILALLAGGAAYAYTRFGKPTPDAVFKAALDNALATPHQQLSMQAPDVTAAIQYDLSKSSDPRVTSDIKVALLGDKLETVSYLSKPNTYISYKDVGSDANKQLGSVLNKWVQLKKDGKAEPGADSSSTAIVGAAQDLASSLSGADWPLGNFAAKDRQTLTDYVLSNQVYSYDAAKVTQNTLDGQKVYVYSVTPKQDKLQELVKKELGMWGFSSDEVDKALAGGVDDISDMKLYIGISSQRLLKLTGTSSGEKETATLTYGSDFPAEPKAQITVGQLNNALATITDVNGDATSSLLSANDEAKDTERQTDINALAAGLEDYAANNNGQYPTVAQMQDADWLSKNFSSVDADAFKDPDGTNSQLTAAPTAHQYSYQAGHDSSLSSCDNGPNPCFDYQLTAILNDGSQYTQKSF
jgi:hypothetical protein